MMLKNLQLRQAPAGNESRWVDVLISETIISFVFVSLREIVLISRSMNSRFGIKKLRSIYQIVIDDYI